MEKFILAWVLGAAALLFLTHTAQAHGSPTTADKKLNLAGVRPRSSSTIKASDIVAAPPCSSALSSLFPSGIRFHVGRHKMVSFTTPRYPRRYLSGTRCGWEFTCDSDSVLELFCPLVDLKPDDYLDLLETKWDGDVYVAGVHGVALNYYFWSDRAKVGFQSDDRGEARGFQCYIWAALSSDLAGPN